MVKKTKKQFKKLGLAWIKEIFDAHPRYFYWGALAVLLLLAISRRPDVIHNAQFWAEDGNVWYKNAYEQGLGHTLFQTYAGYFAVVHRLVAGLSLSLPIYYTPLFFNIVSLGFLLLPAVIALSSRFKTIVKNKYWVLPVCLAYIGMLNVEEIYGNLANIQWPLALTAFLVLFLEKPKNIYWKIFDGFVLAAMGLSSPACILLSPIALYLWYKKRESQQRNNFFLLAGLALLQMSAIAFFSHYDRVGSQPDANVLDLIRMLVGQVFTGGLLGAGFVKSFYENNLLLYISFTAGLALLAYGFVKGPLWLKAFIVFSGFMFFSMLISLKPAPNDNVWSLLTHKDAGQRYWLTPIFGWLATLTWLSFNAKLKAIKYVAIAALVLLPIGIVTNWTIAPYANTEFQTYGRRFDAGVPGETFQLPINPGWTLELTKK